MPVVMWTLVEIPQVQFSVQFVAVVTPTLVEIPQVQFLDLLFMPVVMPTPVENPQVQFLDKVIDVPVALQRQVLMVVQTVCLGQGC